VYQYAISQEYTDKTPEQIVASLLEQGIYLASPSTMYHILRNKNAVLHRQESKAPIKRSAPQPKKADAPNQVWMWDITWLYSPVKGLFYYCYTIIDLFDHSIVGWTVEDSESGEHARALFERITKKLGVYPQFLHSDNGAPMKAYTLTEFLYKHSILPTTSRPRVSNDNPFCESLFKTMKYRAHYPRFFKTIHHARTWMADFVDWYNTKHMHSSLAFCTPEQRRSGVAESIVQTRNQTLKMAKKQNPQRWGSRQVKQYRLPECVYLNRASA
jgi:transposase InsO family protein